MADAWLLLALDAAPEEHDGSAWLQEPRNVSRSVAIDRVHAAAFAAVVAQARSMDSITSILRTMAGAGMWKPLLLLEHCLYDETPIIVKIDFGQGSDKQVGKVFVVEKSWTMLVERLPSALLDPGNDKGEVPAPAFSVLEVCTSPEVRGAANATGETIFDVLQSTMQAPSGLAQLFSMSARLSEVDEGPANNRAETMLEMERGPTWEYMRSLCIPHKIHAAARKTWEIKSEASVVSNVIHSCKVFAMAGSMTRFRNALSQVVQTRFSVIHMPRPDDSSSKSFKDAVMKYFLPPPKHPRRRAAVMLTLDFFNCDWKSRLCHYCHGPSCCENDAASRKKAIDLLHKLTRVLNPKIFNKANWKDWPASLSFFAVLSGLHSVLAEAFQLAFTSRSDAAHAEMLSVDHGGFLDASSMDREDGLGEGFHGPDADNVAAADPFERERAQNAISFRIASEWMAGGHVFEHVFLLRVCLYQQQVFMAQQLHETSAAWEQEQMGKQLMEGTRDYKFTRLHRGDAIHPFMANTMALFVNSDIWQFFHHTELFRTRLFKCLWRPASIIYQLIQKRCEGFPYA
eukprot:3930731-Amphidinium_carterae.1